MGTLTTIFERLFVIVLLVISGFWIIARIKGMTFWEYYNHIFDKFTGETSKPINLGGLKLLDKNTTGRAKKMEKLSPSNKKNLAKMFGGKQNG